MEFQTKRINKVIYQHFNKYLIMANEDEEIEINSDIWHTCKGKLDTEK